MTPKKTVSTDQPDDRSIYVWKDREGNFYDLPDDGRLEILARNETEAEHLALAALLQWYQANSLDNDEYADWVKLVVTREPDVSMNDRAVVRMYAHGEVALRRHEEG